MAVGSSARRGDSCEPSAPRDGGPHHKPCSHGSPQGAIPGDSFPRIWLQPYEKNPGPLVSSSPSPPPSWAPELWTAPLLVTGGFSAVGVQPHVPRGLSPIYHQNWARSGAGGEGRATQSQSTLSPLCPGMATQLLACWCLGGRD